jgi:hypothetical protein
MPISGKRRHFARGTFLPGPAASMIAAYGSWAQLTAGREGVNGIFNRLA